MKGRYERIDVGLCAPAAWTTTRHTKRQAETLRESLIRFGQVQPLVVRTVASNGAVETIDGSARLAFLIGIGHGKVDVVNFGAVLDDTAREMHLALNLDRGKPASDALADALDAVMMSQPDERSKALKEVALLSSLPIAKRGIDKTVARLRSRGRPKTTPHNPNAQPGWVDFKFSVDPTAAQVCDRALSDVERKHSVKRNVALEFICADYLAGAKQGGQS